MTDNPAIEAMGDAFLDTLVSDPVLGMVNLNEALQAALTAYHEHLAAAGFAVVPVEPTKAQIQAMCGAIETATPMDVGDAQDFWGECWTNEAKAAYRAMIAAAKANASGAYKEQPHD